MSLVSHSCRIVAVEAEPKLFKNIIGDIVARIEDKNPVGKSDILKADADNFRVASNIGNCV